MIATIHEEVVCMFMEMMACMKGRKVVLGVHEFVNTIMHVQMAELL